MIFLAARKKKKEKGRMFTDHLREARPYLRHFPFQTQSVQTEAHPFRQKEKEKEMRSSLPAFKVHKRTKKEKRRRRGVTDVFVSWNCLISPQKEKKSLSCWTVVDHDMFFTSTTVLVATAGITNCTPSWPPDTAVSDFTALSSISNFQAWMTRK